MPSALAFVRNARGFRFISFEIFLTDNLSFEYLRSSATLDFVHSLRLVRRLAFLAIQFLQVIHSGVTPASLYATYRASL